MQLCPSCGKANLADAIYCAYCAQRLKAAPPEVKLPEIPKKAAEVPKKVVEAPKEIAKTPKEITLRFSFWPITVDFASRWFLWYLWQHEVVADWVFWVGQVLLISLGVLVWTIARCNKIGKRAGIPENVQIYPKNTTWSILFSLLVVSWGIYTAVSLSAAWVSWLRVLWAILILFLFGIYILTLYIYSVAAPQPKAAPKKRGWIRVAGWVLLGVVICTGLVWMLEWLISLPGATLTAPTMAPTTFTPAHIPTPTPTEAPAGCAAPIAYGPVTSSAKSVTGGWSQEPDNIIPYYTNMAYAVWITQLTEVGLAEWDQNGDLVPELASEVPSLENGGISSDGLTITWRLKDCLYWSDGERITSKDVKFTWQSIMDSRNTVTYRDGYDKIASIDTPDELTVVIRFSELYPPWPTLFTQGPDNSGAILPSHILGGRTSLESDPFIHAPDVSSGPFVITKWVAGDYMILAANPNFYKGRPNLDQIRIQFIPDPETALSMLQTGDIDWYPFFSVSDISTVAALEPRVHLKVVPDKFFEHYYFNLGTTANSDREGFCPFKDVRVRKAIIMGIDRQSIVNTLLAGKTTVLATQWPNSYWTNTDLRPMPYNPEEAKRLLEEAGYGAGSDGIRAGYCNGVWTRLSFNFETTTTQLRQDMAQMARTDLRRIGVDFNPIHTPAGTFFAPYSDGGVLYSGQYDMVGHAFGFFFDPWVDIWLCSSIPNRSNPDGSNLYHYCDSQLDELFAQANATVDMAARKEVFDQIQQYMYDNALIVMMYSRVVVYGYTDRFVPASFGSSSSMNWNAEEWDMKGPVALATDTSTATLTSGATMVSPKDGMVMVYVPAGEFTMGGAADQALAECQKFMNDCQRDLFTNEEPPHTVYLDAFWIDQTEVTNAMYALCVSAGACALPNDTSSYTRTSYYGNSQYDHYPVIHVSWNDASDYCAWADARLPSEAEWEKAARGTDGRAYPWGNSFNGDSVNFCDKNCSLDWADKNYDDGYADTAPVGNYPDGKSPYGALDMAGNVWEWGADWYASSYYVNSPSSNPSGPASGDERVLRGGSWFVYGDVVRSAFRDWLDPGYTDYLIGFRCARSH